MEFKEFECKCCGTLIFIKSPERERPWCPICRGGMVEIETGRPEKLIEYQCSRCQYRFSMVEGQYPYKCPVCNFTFLTTPKRRQEERL